MLARRWQGALAGVLLLTSTASRRPPRTTASTPDESHWAAREALGTWHRSLSNRQRRYKSILILVGLVKVLSNVHVFYPNRENFDFTRVVNSSLCASTEDRVRGFLSGASPEPGYRTPGAAANGPQRQIGRQASPSRAVHRRE